MDASEILKTAHIEHIEGFPDTRLIIRKVAFTHFNTVEAENLAREILGTVRDDLDDVLAWLMNNKAGEFKSWKTYEADDDAEFDPPTYILAIDFHTEAKAKQFAKVWLPEAHS